MTNAAAQQETNTSPGAVARILDLRDSPWVDGPGRTILDTASMIDSNRYQIVVGAFSGPKHGEHAYLGEATRRGLATWPIEETRALDINVLRNIVDWCRTQSVELIHTHDFRSDLYGLAAARRLGLPVVSTCHGWIANDRKGAVYTRIDKFIQRYFDRIIVVSSRMREELTASGVDQGKIALVHNALVVENYAADKTDTRARQDWGIPVGHKLVAKIGRLSPEKRQDLFLRAAAKILETHKDVHFVIIGIGPEQARLEQLAGQLGIRENVIFAGYIKDMQKVYNSLDLVVQSSVTEGMPNVILESLLMRVPVVATDVGGTSEIVEHAASGWLIASNDLDALIEGMRKYLDNADLFDDWAAAGEQRIRKDFCHTLRLQRIMAVYDSVLNERT